MATAEELQTALINADKAGDVDAAKVLANEIIKLRQSAQPQVQPQEVSQDTWNMYFNNQLEPQQKMDIENKIKLGQLKLPENVQASTPTVPMSPERPQDTGVVLQKDYTPTEQIQAGLQTAGTLATGATTGAIGSIAGATAGIINSMIEGTFGTQAGAKQAQKTSEEFAQAGTYQPDNKLAQEYTQNVASVLEPLTAIAPTQTGLSAASRVKEKAPIPKKGEILQGKQQTISEAGITPMTSDITPPTTAIGKVAQSIGEKVPFSGTGAKRVAQQEQRITAVQDLANELGFTVDDVTKNITDDLLQKKRQEISKYSGVKKEIFNKIDDNSGALLDATKTTKTLDSEIEKIRNLGLAENDKAIATLEDFKQAFQSKNINQIEDLRKALGNKLNDEGLTSVKDILEKSVQKVYTSLNEDLGSHIKQYGDKNDFTKWQVANKRLTNSMGDLKVSSFKRLLDKGEAIPETVNKMLFSKNKSEQHLLFKNLSQDGKANARVAIINKIMAESIGKGEELSTARFITALKKNDIPISTFFKGKDLEKIKGLSKALNLTSRAEVSGLNPPTGVQALMPVVFSGLGASLGATGGVAAGFGLGAIARAYESQAVSNLLIKLRKAPKAQESGLLKLIDENVKKILTIESQIQGEDDGK